ncbi:Serine protease snake [Harpegnathos saltator]|uniref:Serine protease snake n=1 Tax=Harpegnathos saltator TaxID=610380 RepID=E2B4A2_HARSA|nr:Serine protease snake [Harpegnathos saltator]
MALLVSYLEGIFKNVKNMLIWFTKLSIHQFYASMLARTEFPIAQLSKRLSSLAESKQSLQNFHICGPATKVRVGLIDLLSPGDAVQERKIVKSIKHPNYKHAVSYHDIALFKLDQPLELNPKVRPACLEANSQIQGKSAIASGFGKTSYESNVGSNELMKVQLDYISEDDCKKSYTEDLGSRRLPQGLIPNLLCAGIMEGGKDTCQGDSGGPLQRVLVEPYCMYSIVGVTSFGKFCAFKSMPAVYTKVSSYTDWIENIVWP